MTNNPNLVRFSRAGDQFHYLWAARRCLALLRPDTDLACITVEAVSVNEASEANQDSGEHVIDIAEYFGSDKLVDCSHVSYYQLKHSTKNIDKPWTLSGLKKTVEGFFKRYKAFKNGISNAREQHADFVFTTNRPVAPKIHSLLDRIKKRELRAGDLRSWEQLKRYLTTNEDSQAYEFLDHFRIDDTNDSYWQQRNILIEELRAYIPGVDSEGSDQLWRLVTEKALPHHSTSPEITREDVLRVLNTTEDELFPAPCLIESGESFFSRAQEDEFLERILSSDGVPVVIHAGSGEGKTAMATRLQKRICDQSTSVLYDCFGNGTYRSVVHFRHGHGVGLVQITNELASLKLCQPMIPSKFAQPQDYLRAFRFRLEQAITILRARHPDAQLVIFIDAADNAEMASEEYNERASFPRDLIRQSVPDGVSIVYLCRSHRRRKLRPPPDYIDLALEPFSRVETAQLLKKKFPDATKNDIAEFHRLSHQNPRVQATSLAANMSLAKTLEMLGPNPISADDTISAMFQRSIDRLLDEVPDAEAVQIGLFCEALAALRPFIPIKVLSVVSGLPETAIRSFVIDLGRPMSITGDSIQFFDEPSETWFRETYRPSKRKLGSFIDKIRPLTSKNSYVASALPQLMLEAGQYDELVDMVLSDTDLPNDNPVDRRNASMQRLQFSLKAALRNKRYEDAAKLALKGGGEAAGDDRQRALLQDNTDLVSHLLPDHRLREIVAQKGFTTEWHGGHHAYEAALLSGCVGTLSESRGYLRLAHRWVGNWSRLSKKKRKQVEISDKDIAEMAFAQLNLGGASAMVAEIESWSPKVVAYRVGSIVFARLVDLGRFDLLDRIAEESGGNLCIQLALIHAQNQIIRYPSERVVKSAMDGLNFACKQLRKLDSPFGHEQELLSVVNSVVQAATFQGALPNAEIVAILDRYIPEPNQYYFSSFSDEPRFTLLRANCLRAALSGGTIELLDLASPKIRKRIKQNRHSYDRDTQQFLKNVGSVLPWHKLWTRALLHDLTPDTLGEEIEKCVNESRKNTNLSYREDGLTSKEISRLWIETITIVNPTSQRIQRFAEWKKSLNRPLSAPALTYLGRACARNDPLMRHSFDFAKEAFDLINSERMDAECEVESYCEISRSVFTASVSEATYYFDQAVEVAGKIGEENLNRWSSFLELATVASDFDNPNPELAYRLSRAAELTYNYVARDKYFDWEGTVEAITVLCPSSGPTILSRWRDREFGLDARLFPKVFSQLVDINKISPESWPAFIGFRYQWKVAELLDQAFSHSPDLSVQARNLEIVLPYLLQSDTTSDCWERIIKIARRCGCDADQLDIQLERAKYAELIDRKKEGSRIGQVSSKPDTLKDWNSIFVDLNTGSTKSTQDAFRRMRSGEPPYYTLAFAQEFFVRVREGTEASALSTIFGAERLFSLVGLITLKLSAEEAASTLSYGLRLIEEDMTEEDGDGDWHSALCPPATVNEALAGYLWASLASPHSGVRWQAAHVVCLLCSFDSKGILRSLADLAFGKSPNHFHDIRLPFYEFSAQLWLLLALRRAIRLGLPVAPHFADFLQQSCSQGQRHVIIRGIAACALLNLHEEAKVDLSNDERIRLKGINESNMENIESRSYHRDLEAPAEGAEVEDDRFYFSYDITASWFKSLGRIFALGSSEIERRAAKVVREDWGIQGPGGWDADPRAQRGLFRDGVDAYSKYSHPNAENLGFYRAYNAMMLVAGDLIDSVQRHQDSDCSDELISWLNGHLPTRADGLWLADRRDPQPPDTPKWKEEDESDEWPFSVQRSDLLNAVWLGGEELCVWGSWDYSLGDRQEDLRVSSAFVSPRNSMALLRALQTSSVPHGSCLPSTESDTEIKHGAYRLKAWIQESSTGLGIDDFDPWAGDIRYPPLQPAEWFVKQFNLRHDHERRSWFGPEQNDSALLRSQMWGRKSQRNDFCRPETGQRIVTSKTALLKQLAVLEMDLILEIQIRRDFRRESFRRDKSSFSDYVPPYILFTILDANGRLKTIW